MLFIAEKQQKTILNFALDLLIVAEYYKQCNTHIHTHTHTHTHTQREREGERESERETYTQKNLLNEASNFKFVTRN